jgi:predicted aspartyl protease
MVVMRTFTFQLNDEDSLIHVDCNLVNDEYTVAIDTGASHTVFDITPLLIAGFELSQSQRTVQFETGKGIIDAYVFRVSKISALGITRRNFDICAYDFLGNNILSDFDGLLGLDFFKNTDLNISFKRFEVTVS